MLRATLPLALLVVALPAQAGWVADGGYTTGFRGLIGFEDAGHDLSGEPMWPASPLDAQADVWVDVEADASWDDLIPDCDLFLSGDVTGMYMGEGRISEDNVYVAAFNETDAEFLADAGCMLSDVTLGSVAGATLRVEIEASRPQCEAFCAAAGRSEGEAMCGFEPSDAECRLAEEASVMASCMVSCTEEASRIVGEVEVGARALGRMNRGLSAEGWGVVRTNVMVDHLETAEGDELDF